MKFMLILKSSKDSEAGKMPSEESIAAMVKYAPSTPDCVGDYPGMIGKGYADFA